MTKHQLDTIHNIEGELTRIYWELKDNHEDRAANRLDTILKKLYELKCIERS